MADGSTPVVAEGAEAEVRQDEALSDALEQEIERSSGLDVGGVRVNRESAVPAQPGAAAYAEGGKTHIAGGQEVHVPHEAWHVVEQNRGRVQPATAGSENVPVNASADLEAEAQHMGEAAMLVLESPPAPVVTKPAAKKTAVPKEEVSQSPFTISVGAVYDGPMDLLLDLIRRQSIDIYDIPMATITQQFLQYCEHLKQADVDSAADFVYTASLLIHIKSKMLLPREASLIAAGDMEDPRRELVERLLEHARFKAAAQMLLQKQQIEDATWSNPGTREFKEAAGADREIAADTTDLARVFSDILDRLRSRPVLNVNEDSVTVAQMLEYCRRRLMLEDKPTSLRRLLQNTHSQGALICMFLAVLELVRLGAVMLRQGQDFGDIALKKTDGFDEVLAHQERMRDDWR